MKLGILIKLIVACNKYKTIVFVCIPEGRMGLPWGKSHGVLLGYIMCVSRVKSRRLVRQALHSLMCELGLEQESLGSWGRSAWLYLSVLPHADYITSGKLLIQPCLESLL